MTVAVACVARLVTWSKTAPTALSTEGDSNSSKWFLFMYLKKKNVHFIIPFGKFVLPYLGKARTPLIRVQSGCVHGIPLRLAKMRGREHYKMETTSGVCLFLSTVGRRKTWLHSGPVSSKLSWMMTLKNSHKCSCAPDGVLTSGLWISRPTVCQLSHPVCHIGMK